MIRATVAIWTTVLVLCVSEDLRLVVRDSLAASAVPAATRDACAHYRARAAAAPARQPVRLAALLSESCVVALRSLRGPSREERVAAAVYLTRVARLRQVVAELNGDRGAAGPAPSDDAQGTGQVTPTGEFLIAHRLGVLRAFEAWLDTGADFSLASYR